MHTDLLKLLQPRNGPGGIVLDRRDHLLHRSHRVLQLLDVRLLLVALVDEGGLMQKINNSKL